MVKKCEYINETTFQYHITSSRTAMLRRIVHKSKAKTVRHLIGRWSNGLSLANDRAWCCRRRGWNAMNVHRRLRHGTLLTLTVGPRLACTSACRTMLLLLLLLSNVRNYDTQQKIRPIIHQSYNIFFVKTSTKQWIDKNIFIITCL